MLQLQAKQKTPAQETKPTEESKEQLKTSKSPFRSSAGQSSGAPKEDIEEDIVQDHEEIQLQIQ